MDPRSKATTAELEQQQSLGLEIFGEVRRSRQVLAEMRSVQDRIEERKPQLKEKPELLAQAEKLEAAMDVIEKGSKTAPDAMGLATASSGLQSVLRVVEGGDRTTPQQALDVYKLSDDAAKSRIAEWNVLKRDALAAFNGALKTAGLATIDVSALQVAEDKLSVQ
jgi:hypothetical protein